MPFAEKTNQKRLAHFPLKQLPNQEVTYYLFIKSDNMVRVDFSIFDGEAAAKHEATGITLLGITLGSFIILAGYHIFIWLGFRDPAYLHYSFFVLGLIAINITLGGVTEIYQLRPFGYSFMAMGKYTLLLAPLLSIPFTASFLSINKNTDTFWYRALALCFGILSLEILLIAVGQLALVQKMMDPTVGITAMVLVAAAVAKYRKGYKPAKFYLVGWSLLLGSVGIWTVGRMGLMSYNQWVLMAPLLGNVVEATFMALALGHRVKIIEKERIAALLNAEAGQRAQHLLRLLSHDMGNGLSIILGCSKLGVKTATSEEDKRYFNKIFRATQNLVT